MVEAVKRNYPQREIADAAFALQQEIDGGERIVVGVNRYALEHEEPLPTLRIDPALERKQIGRLQAARATRDGAAVERALAALREDAAHERAQPDGPAARTAPARTPPRARSCSRCSRCSATTPRRPSSERRPSTPAA